MPENTNRPFSMARYLRLVRRLPLVPIENEEQLDRAIEVMHELVDIGISRERNPEEDAYLFTLGCLIQRYEDVAYPMEPIEDSVMLARFLEDHGLTQTELARGAGISRSTVSAVLQGKRKFTCEQIGKVAKWFKVSPHVFSAAG